LEEHADEYFDLKAPSPYMLLVADVKPGKRIALIDETAEGFDKFKQVRSVIPAVTHVDHSARLQTVNPRQHPDFYKLIKAFYDLTGCPMVINTSFNRMDEPIVCTPADAIACFINTGIDVLVMEGFVVRK
jgi:carbamoyltransferase